MRFSAGRSWGEVVLLLLLLFASTARAAIPLCVDVRGPEASAADLSRLVQDEVAHHPSHQLVEQGCASRLAVELLDVEGARFLTARANDAIPVRYRVASPEALGDLVRDAVAATLCADPVMLAEDPTRLSAVQRAAHGILQRGLMRYRVELFELMVRSAPDPSFASGVAFGLTRGSESWLAALRLYVAGSPSAREKDQRHLRLASGLDAGLTWEASARASTSFYAHAGLGLQVLQFVGLPSEATGGADALVKIGAVFQGRVGVRLLRHTDADVDVFLAGYVPLFNTNDVDAPLFGEGGLYTPSVQAGIGIGF